MEFALLLQKVNAKETRKNLKKPTKELSDTKNEEILWKYFATMY